MKRKPIFIGFTDANVIRWGLRFCHIGGGFSVTAKFCGDPPRPISGEVVAVYEETHGKTIIIRNDRVGDTRYLCSGWKYIAIWIGCGNSGVLAHWKDPISESRLEVEQAIDDWRTAYALLRREQEARRAEAL